MRIDIKQNGKTFSVECDEDQTLPQMVDILKGMLIQLGFHPVSVDELFVEYAGELGNWNLSMENETTSTDLDHLITNQTL